MSLLKTIVRNVVSSWVGYAVHAVVALLLTPYILRSLGETRYGIWALANGLTGYYGLLDLGIGAGIGQYLTRYLASNKRDYLDRTASTGVFALSAVGVLIGVCSLILAVNASRLFRIPPDLAREVELAVIFTGASAVLQCVFFTYSAVFVALQRFDLSNAVGILTRVVSALAMLLSLRMGYGLVGLSLALACANTVDYLVRWRVARKLLPSLKVSARLISRQHLLEVMKYGIWNLGITIGVRLISYTDELVIGVFLPIAAVAPYAIAVSLRTYFEDVFMRAGWVFAPAATELDARKNSSALQSLYLVSSKFMFLGSIWCGALALTWSTDFFRLWVGPTHANPPGYPSIASIFSVLLVACMIGVGQRVGYQVLHGTRRLPLLASLIAMEGICNLLLSIVLVHRFGLTGVAAGTLIPAAIFQGILQPLVVVRSLGIHLSVYCNRVLVRPFLVLLLGFPMVRLFASMQSINGWLMLLVSGLISAAALAPLVIFIGMDRNERRMSTTLIIDALSKATMSQKASAQRV
jgi:O-antigen/teichoic acid export membrane protein